MSFARTAALLIHYSLADIRNSPEGGRNLLTSGPYLIGMKPDFHDIAGLWEPDGSLRDIYVQGTEAAHWDRFDRLLNQYECTYSFNGVLQPFPGSRNVLVNREGPHLLSILLSGRVVICCHFFISEQLELDISPREVTGPLQHEEVLTFVENLAEALALPADITPENSGNAPFLTYVPQPTTWHTHCDPLCGQPP